MEFIPWLHPQPGTCSSLLVSDLLLQRGQELASFRAEASTEDAGAVWRLPGVREEDVLGAALGNETKMT